MDHVHQRRYVPALGVYKVGEFEYYDLKVVDFLVHVGLKFGVASLDVAGDFAHAGIDACVGRAIDFSSSLVQGLVWYCFV